MKAFLNLLAALIVMGSCVWSSGIPAKSDEAALAIASRVAEVEGGQDALLDGGLRSGGDSAAWIYANVAHAGQFPVTRLPW